MSELSCFKAYDIRGRVPEEIDDALAYRLGRSLALELGARSVVVGHDVRLESPGLARALHAGITDQGADVIDIGLCGTEEVYFQTAHRGACGGVMITASHNPKGYNGFKLVRAGARPISGDSGLGAIRDRVAAGVFPAAPRPGRVIAAPDKGAYVDHLLTYVDAARLPPLTIVADPGNGGAGPVIRLLAERLPLRFVLINETPDGTFPNGVPNPLLPENRAATARAVVAHGADFGIAWDGDFDRCFLYGSDGGFVEGYYMVGLLAAVLLAKSPGAKIIHDPRLTWNTQAEVRRLGGIPVQSKTGHAFIKERMRAEDAVYGGEMSAHHYFRDFFYCDSGMIPWLLVAELIGRSGRSLADLVRDRIAAFPCSGEINYRVEDAPAVIRRVVGQFRPAALAIDETDGVSLEFADWRFNLRSSNTEPLLRLNVETRGESAAVAERVGAIEALIRGM